MCKSIHSIAEGNCTFGGLIYDSGDNTVSSDASTICAISETHLIVSYLLLQFIICKTVTYESSITTHNTRLHHNDDETICKDCYLVNAIDKIL